MVSILNCWMLYSYDFWSEARAESFIWYKDVLLKKYLCPLIQPQNYTFTRVLEYYKINS